MQRTVAFYIIKDDVIVHVYLILFNILTLEYIRSPKRYTRIYTFWPIATVNL